MAFTPGTRLGVYEVTAQIGEGGMGQVYRATDTTLGRHVAIKILPDAFASAPERLARFEREAKTLASLNHPHIAAIYGFEKSAGLHALVMELVEGEDLSQRIVRGAIPIDEALPIAKQIADALEAAHEQGIIHRDLKPANIKVRADGTVKVLDFGLAKAMEPAAGSSPSMSMSPTITTPAMMTGVGMILGTAAYMSPEQARGKTVDRRADIWAFGAVLFEMLTGTRAFAGDDVSDVLASVLAREPEWTRLPASLSPALSTYIRRCLHKNPKQRIADVQDVRLALEGAFETAAPQTASPTSAAPRGRPVWMAAFAVAAALAAALTVPALRHLRETPPPAPPETRLDIVTPATSVPVSFALSPDGRQLVFVASGE
ncbi:MAG: serine/threonine-protein kinase, partial [Vicinamibacterales bacterium]|nr:serine/threonine-protein kinase [Vicinamibacterales bacterium]